MPSSPFFSPLLFLRHEFLRRASAASAVPDSSLPALESGESVSLPSRVGGGHGGDSDDQKSSQMSALTRAERRLRPRASAFEPIPEERLQSLFLQVDTDGNGRIDVAELGEGMKLLGLPENPHLVQDFMRAFDVSGDDLIDYPEFVAFVRLREAQIARVFQDLDLDRSGDLTSKEVKAGLYKLHRQVSEADVQRLIRKMDRNCDDVISFDEFRTFVFQLPKTNIYRKDVLYYWRKHGFDLGEIVNVPETLDDSYKPATLLLAGGIAGAISRTATAPFDRIKVLMQAGETLGGEAYVGILPSMRRVYAEAGIRGFFRGNGTNVIKIAPESALKFLAYEKLKRAFAEDDGELQAYERFAAGAIAGGLAQFIIYPLEITKTRLAVAPRGMYSGISSCVFRIARDEGFFTLYRGLGASLAGIIPYAGVDLGMYSFLRDLWMKRHPDEEPDWLTTLLSGAVSSTCGQIVAYPMALVRTRLQSQGIQGKPLMYTGIYDCLRTTVRQEGVKGLYRGIMPNFLKAIPAISISYVVYEKAKQWLSGAL
mmetsp:Transcript_11773/g.35907  ORF Transcript_11773/g.35907 Transcript_11773/m.35907 type:complete len:539 (-) Transcript_11773:44-1660(-)